MNLQELEKERDKQVTGFFWLALYIAFIFLIPAVLAVFLGKKLNFYFNIKYLELLFLLIAFALSWYFVIIKYKQKTKLLKDIEEKIKALKNR